ncbi:MAG: hypothetical protein ACRD0V_22530 [Acidimicrobiales bacterium]
MEASEFSSRVLDAPRELRTLREPAGAEQGFAFELGDKVLGSGHPAVGFLGDRLAVGSAVLFSIGVSSGDGLGDVTPAMPLTSSDVRSVDPELGVLALATGLVELARRAPVHRAEGNPVVHRSQPR